MSQHTVRVAIRRHRRRILAAQLLLAGHQLGEAGVPIVLGLAIDHAVRRPDVARMTLWLLVLAGDFLLLSMCWRFGSRLAAAVRLGLSHDLRMAVVDRALVGAPAGSDPRWLVDGELLTLATSDSRRVADAVRSALSVGAGLALLIAALVDIGLSSLLLAAAVAAGAGLTLVLTARLGRRIEDRTHAEQESSADAAALAIDVMAGLRVLAGLGATATAISRYRTASEIAVTSAVRVADAEAAVSGIAATAVGVYLLGVAAASAELGLHGTISIGAVIAALGLSQLLLGPLQTLGQAVPVMRAGRAAAERVHRATDADAPRPDTALAGVPAVPPTLRIADREMLGVVCEDPADAELLARTLDVGDALVWPHGAFPPGDTVAEVLAVERAGTARAQEAVDALAGSDVLARIPGGWAGTVLARGAGLSGGERQRLALARLLVEAPGRLVLTEPTSAVDPVTEQRLAEGLRRLRRSSTTVVFTTSPALLAACDRVTLLQRTEPATSGRHEELLADPRYRELIGR